MALVSATTVESPLLRVYLELERLVLAREPVDACTTDALRDAMDLIWYALTEQERRVLDRRSVDAGGAIMPTQPESAPLLAELSR